MDSCSQFQGHDLHLSTCETFDIGREKWYSFPSMRSPRAWHGMAVTMEGIYAFGGMTAEWNVSDTVERFVGLINQWAVIGTKLLQPRYSFAAVAIRID